MIRGAILKTNNEYLERAVQHLYPMELNCDSKQKPGSDLNVEASEFRPKRNAATVSNIRINEQLQEKESETLVEH